MTDNKFLCGFVSLIGPANAGKSTLLNQILNEKIAIVSSKPHTTRNRITGIKTTERGQIVFFDTPGFAYNIRQGELKRYLINSRRTASDGVDCVALVLDASILVKEKGFEVLPQLLNAAEEKQIHIIVLNKIDRFKTDLLLPLLAKLHETLERQGASTPIPEIVPLSAQKGIGVDEFISAIWKYIPEGPAHYPCDTSTDQAEEFYIGEIIREKLFERMRQEIPYSVAVMVDDIRENPKVMSIFATIYVEHANQKSIVIGSKARALKAVGIAAREELEHIFGIKINLQLYVKVEEDWSKSVKGLKKVGYRDFES